MCLLSCAAGRGPVRITFPWNPCRCTAWISCSKTQTGSLLLRKSALPTNNSRTATVLSSILQFLMSAAMVASPVRLSTATHLNCGNLRCLKASGTTTTLSPETKKYDKNLYKTRGLQLLLTMMSAGLHG